jgi:DNA polymerase-3 subunit delta
MADIQALIRDARAGKFDPAYLFVGSERFFVERAVSELRRAVIGEQPDAFNEEIFFGKSAQVDRVIEAARTLPMLARSRFVLVRGIDGLRAPDLDLLAGYLEAPAASCCLVLTAEKIDGRTRLAKIAKKGGFWVDAGPLRPSALRGFAVSEVSSRGHKLSADAASWLVDAIGNDLSAIDDALERLSLYVGKGKPIGLAAVESCVSRARVDSIWALVDAVSMRDSKGFLKAAASLLSHGEPPLRILSMIARQLRMVARIQHALHSGMSPEQAASEAGAPPFKARDLAVAARRFRNADLAAAFQVLAETDVALKSSRRPPETVLQGALVDLGRFDARETR